MVDVFWSKVVTFAGMNSDISIRKAEVNNLKGISLDIPRDKFVVITGISGSGKSSLAFDTLFAEGQRRYAESISSFARQFLGRMSKPAVESISGIPPAVAVEQKVNTRNPRSTVGTTTEVYDYLRLLFARIGHTFSPVSGEEVTCDTPETVFKYVRELHGTIYLLSDIRWGQEKYRVERLLSLKEAGFSRLFVMPCGNNSASDGPGAPTVTYIPAGNAPVSGTVEKIDTVLQQSERFADAFVFLMVDRLKRSEEEDLDEYTESRLQDSIRTAFNQGEGHVAVAGEILMGKDGSESDSGLEQKWIIRQFSTLFEADGMMFEKPQEWLFNFNNPLGACPVCGGFGKTMGIDEALVVPNQALSIFEDAIVCWRGEVMRYFKEELMLNASKYGISIHKPYNELTQAQKDIIWNGNSDITGIMPFFKELESKRYKVQNRYMLSRYTGKTVCRDCGGSRLRKEALYVKVGGKNMAELLSMSITELKRFFDKLALDEYDSKIASRALKEIRQRLDYIINVGLGYLTLSRASNTLSGGESQRINLVSSLGNSLTGSMYILDEPSIGLHQRDTQRLISVIKSLRDLGNTVIVVEHDEEIIRAADWLIDIGPGAGIHGGQVVYQGPPPGRDSGQELLERYPDSLTLQYLTKAREITIEKGSRKEKGFIEVCDACENNLKNIDVKFPLGVLTAVTGVSGSGKSSLVGDILYPALMRALGQTAPHPGAFRELRGNLDAVSSVEYVDQNPIGKSARSNPVTYLKVYDDIRKLYSEQPYAKLNKYGHSHFSFNIDGGRCPECQGDGTVKIPMQFMADIVMTCESCGGKRFLPDILEVKYRGLDISQVLDLSVDEAIRFFSGGDVPGSTPKPHILSEQTVQPTLSDTLSLRIAEGLQPLHDVGLGYVKLGQSSSTLSGGESQRVKLASFLGKELPAGRKGKILFIFDEPTTGLHFDDIEKLLKSFRALLEKGHTIIVVEHNPYVIAAADHIIELGPEGGDGGGYLIKG